MKNALEQPDAAAVPQAHTLLPTPPFNPEEPLALGTLRVQVDQFGP